MTKLRETRLAEGHDVPQPYVYIQAPITAFHLLSPDHHHRVAMRSSFVVRLVPRKKSQALPTPSSTGAALPEKVVPATSPPNAEGVSEQPKRPDSAASSVMSSARSVYANQLGRPTKSNIKTQRMIAEISVATAIDEDSQKENFRTEVCPYF